MRILLSVILLQLSISGFAQIPLEKLISFTNNKYSVVADYLIENGWEFKGQDTTDGLHNTWTLGYNESIKEANHWLYCFFNTYPKINKDSINSIVYMNVSQAEFLQYFNDLPSFGFKRTKTMDYKGDITVIYEKTINDGKKKAHMMVELLQFIKPGSTIRRTMYQVSIGYFG
jgi:hypothetical protein